MDHKFEQPRGKIPITEERETDAREAEGAVDLAQETEHSVSLSDLAYLGQIAETYLVFAGQRRHGSCRSACRP